MPEVIWGVEVNETRVLTYGGSDAERWLLWRSRMERTGRITTLAIGAFGDTVHVACEDRQAALDLIDCWHSGGMVHKSTAKVRQLVPADVPEPGDWDALVKLIDSVRAAAGEASPSDGRHVRHPLGPTPVEVPDGA
ncbi:hypothetical protein ACQP2T_63825 (plasmid) [Nonomuraea sp. CA-143628]|uniref:hypothetical protein n=1 Tax=Nonomuraea sp. CA-143628 TaxID=3239997 RepID=UPI003D8F0CAB